MVNRLTPWVAALLCCCLHGSVPGQIRDASVDELVEQLDDSDLPQRRDAIYELVRRGANTPEVIAGFAKLIEDRDRQIRFQALLGLARAGSLAEPATPALLEELGNRDAQVRYRAAVALGAIGESCVPALLEHWSEHDDRQKAYVAQALTFIGPPARPACESLTEVLQSEDEDLRLQAARALAAIDGDNEERMLSLARHSDAQLRGVAVTQLAAGKKLSPVGEQALRAAAKDDSESVRELAIVAIAKSNLSNQVKSEVVEAALSDSSAAVRAAALSGMASAKLSAKGLVDRLIERIRSAESSEQAEDLVRAFSLLEGNRSKVLPVLFDMAEREDADQQLIAQTIAAGGSSTVMPLLEAAADRPHLQPLVAEALGRIGVEAIGELSRNASSKHASVRVACVEALGKVRPAQEELVPPLVQALEDPLPEVRAGAVTALGSLADQLSEDIVKSYAEQLQASATDEVEQVRAAFVEQLPRLDLSDKNISKFVEAGLSDAAEAVARGTLAALKQLPDQLAKQSDQVVELAGSSSASLRSQALQALGQLDEDKLDEATRSTLIKGLRDEALEVRLAATESLIQLRWASSESVQALSENLAEDSRLLEATLRAIEVAGVQAQGLSVTIANLLNHPESAIRMAAVRAMAAIDSNKAKLAQRLAAALDDSEWAVRQAAAENLAGLGADAVGAIPKLFLMLANEEDTNFASGAIKEIGRAPPEAKDLFLKNLHSNDRRTSLYAIFLLGNMGPAGEEVLPRLRQELQDADKQGSDSSRRRFLRQAIESIEEELKASDDSGK